MQKFYNIEKSKIIKGLEWTGDRIGYPEAVVRGDTYPMTWAHDGDIYTSSGDPGWSPEGVSDSGIDVEKFSGGPADYKITKVNRMLGFDGCGGGGPKPSGMICVDSIFYLAFQNSRRLQPAPHSLRSQHGSDAHIIYSASPGWFWTPDFASIPPAPMFPGCRFGGPAFVNFGQNNANARDRYVYAVSSDQWDNGSNLRLGRVPADSIVRREAWEWVCAYGPTGEPAWHHDIDLSIPILTMHKHLGMPEMVYLAGLERYMLFTWRFRKDFSSDDGTDLLVFEAPEPWGPFSLVHYEELWQGREFNPYCPRLPLKWMADDHRSGWLQFSGAWNDIGVSKLYYRSNVRPFKFIMQ